MLASAVVVIAVAIPAAASADQGQAVVTATIYPASGGSVSSQTVSLAALDACPIYSGSSPLYLHNGAAPGAQPFQPATDSAWALSTVIECALKAPLSDVTGVQVSNPAHGYEALLSSAQLSDPSQFHDPQAPQALPLISSDGTEDQNTYVRPWLGGADDNARDQVVQPGAPISIVVYENGPPLTVNATEQTLSETSTSMTAKLSATVQDAAGNAVPASALTWSWNFGDGGRSSDATPSHAFAPGSYSVTVR